MDRPGFRALGGAVLTRDPPGGWRGALATHRATWCLAVARDNGPGWHYALCSPRERAAGLGARGKAACPGRGASWARGRWPGAASAAAAAGATRAARGGRGPGLATVHGARSGPGFRGKSQAAIRETGAEAGAAARDRAGHGVAELSRLWSGTCIAPERHPLHSAPSRMTVSLGFPQ
ncbi:spidroin-1-like isoform X2 [Nycticebus coucang]|uniref:spidroin-1-like isoform X2 n=1 Tax=Nycticebus coucang TaxID=9470 RepID=UPI00234C74B0|nr:spidroin-1-like isoform X2 [Nycticebus coucang]